MTDTPPAPAPDPDATPIAGEAVTLDAIIPSEDQQAAESSNRIGRTAVQVSLPAALVVVGTWIARLAGLDLDPGAGVDMPAEVAGAWVAVVAVLLAYRMNRAPKG